MVNPDFTFYKGKRVFLTGHTGFKGTWMLCWLNRLGATVKGYALAPEQKGELFNTVQGNTFCESVIADIRDKEKLEQELLSFQPDLVFHLAAQPLVRLSYETPSYTFEVNAIGTTFLLDAVRKLDKPCSVVLITTDKVYENKEWHYPYRESDRLGGYDPYSASKAAAELVIASYRNSFFNLNKYYTHHKAIAAARAGNVIGGGDYAKDRIIPDIVKSLREGKPIVLRNPGAVRPWQHVLEPLAGYLTLGKRLTEEPLRFADAWNFGPFPEDNLTVGQLSQLAVDTWGSGSIVVEGDEKGYHEAGLLKLDISKAVAEMNWSPLMRAKEAIRMTMNWYRNELGGNAYTLVQQDIDHYESLFS